MALTKRQKAIDEMKWLKSQELGEDACGTFDFCVKCNKALENPCDKAYKKFHAKPVEKKPVAKSAMKKTTTAAKAARKKPSDKE